MGTLHQRDMTDNEFWVSVISIFLSLFVVAAGSAYNNIFVVLFAILVMMPLGLWIAVITKIKDFLFE
jgi:uncharacterized membrane protein YoaK (UPF0700 family)